MEPYRLRRWRLPTFGETCLYTCARPGRSKGSKGKVSDQLLHDWIAGLPKRENVTVISLLGTKPDGTSEYSFYSFFGKGWSFQRWLNQNYPSLRIKVAEYPTQDFSPVPEEISRAVASQLTTLLPEQTVMLMDSGGESRVRQVCNYLRAIEDSRA